MGTQKCRLCQKNDDLKESHIIPAFVFRWLKKTSATGYLRFADHPNKRVQDGIKLPWLCGGCEDRLSKLETSFANEIFLPFCENKKNAASYGPWMLKFSVSLVWRAATFMCNSGPPPHFTSEQQVVLMKALERWRLYLLDEVPHPAEFEVHLLPLNGEMNSWPGGAPPNLNRWALRTPEMDLASSEMDCFVYVKLPRFVFVGFVNMTRPRDWGGTKLHINNKIGPSTYNVPRYFGEYLRNRMNKIATIKRKISSKQSHKIEISFRENLDRAARSDFFTALKHDLEKFGHERVFPPDGSSS